ncbi:MAG TPA: hypothetical protein VKI61_13790 [Chitinophagaceae bacterium]|jgi:hypothetical protein|nr:hypothetical protein [Chitinophagaceae bacterium]
MTLLKRIVAIFTLTISLYAFGQKNCDYKIDTAKILLNENLDSFLFKIKQETFSVSHDKKDIPSFIKKQLDCWTRNFSIGNPKETFNATDIYDEKLPDRQLLFLAVNTELFIMTYLRGGFGEQTHMLFIKFHSNRIVDLWTGVSLQDLKSKNEVLDYIKTHRNKDWGLNTNIIYF